MKLKTSSDRLYIELERYFWSLNFWSLFLVGEEVFGLLLFGLFKGFLLPLLVFIMGLETLQLDYECRQLEEVVFVWVFNLHTATIFGDLHEYLVNESIVCVVKDVVKILSDNIQKLSIRVIHSSGVDYLFLLVDLVFALIFTNHMMLFLALIFASDVVDVDALLVDVVHHFLSAILSFDRQLGAEFRWPLRSQELPSFLSDILLCVQFPPLLVFLFACNENLLRREILKDLVLNLKKWKT